MTLESNSTFCTAEPEQTQVSSQMQTSMYDWAGWMALLFQVFAKIVGQQGVAH